jgi:diacylglycerol O-acyltransferase
VELLSRRASLVVSNVPGPAGARHIAGRRLVAVVAFAPVTGALGLGVTCVGYDGSVSVGVASGMDGPSLPDELVAGVTREFEALAGGGFGERDA